MTAARATDRIPDLLRGSFPGVVVVGIAGRGRRCLAVAVRGGGRDLVVKLYHPRALARHALQYGGSLAKFEFERNAAFRGFPGFAEFSARPVGFLVMPRVEAFVQERIFGQPLIEFLRKASAPCRRRVVLDLRSLHERSEMAGVLDLDLHPSNILVRRSADGLARPVLFDFNKVPYRARRPHGVIDWCRNHGLLGFRSDDRRHLGRFERIGSCRFAGPASHGRACDLPGGGLRQIPGPALPARFPSD